MLRLRPSEPPTIAREAHESARDLPPSPAPQRPTPEQTQRIARLQQRVKDVAAGLGIQPEVLATRRDVEGMVLGSPEESPLLRGWRREAIGLQLLELLG